MKVVRPISLGLKGVLIWQKVTWNEANKIPSRTGRNKRKESLKVI